MKNWFVNKVPPPPWLHARYVEDSLTSYSCGCSTCLYTRKCKWSRKFYAFSWNSITSDFNNTSPWSKRKLRVKVFPFLKQMMGSWCLTCEVRALIRCSWSLWMRFPPRVSMLLPVCSCFLLLVLRFLGTWANTPQRAQDPHPRRFSGHWGLGSALLDSSDFSRCSPMQGIWSVVSLCNFVWSDSRYGRCSIETEPSQQPVGTIIEKHIIFFLHSHNQSESRIMCIFTCPWSYYLIYTY